MACVQRVRPGLCEWERGGCNGCDVRGCGVQRLAGVAGSALISSRYARYTRYTRCTRYNRYTRCSRYSRCNARALISSLVVTLPLHYRALISSLVVLF